MTDLIEITDIEALLRRAMVEDKCPSISIVKVDGGYQVNRQDAKRSNTFNIAIMPDPADALFNVLAHYTNARRRPKVRSNEDLV